MDVGYFWGLARTQQWQEPQSAHRRHLKRTGKRLTAQRNSRLIFHLCDVPLLKAVWLLTNGLDAPAQFSNWVVLYEREQCSQESHTCEDLAHLRGINRLATDSFQSNQLVIIPCNRLIPHNHTIYDKISLILPFNCWLFPNNSVLLITWPHFIETNCIWVKGVIAYHRKNSPTPTDQSESRIPQHIGALNPEPILCKCTAICQCGMW